MWDRHLNYPASCSPKDLLVRLIIFGYWRPSSGGCWHWLCLSRCCGSSTLVWLSAVLCLASLRSLLFQVFICTTLVGKCMLSVLVTAASLFRVEIATSTTVSTLPLSVRFPAAAASRFLTIRNLLSFWLSLSTMGLRPCMNSPRCALFEWVLSRWVVWSLLRL